MIADAKTAGFKYFVIPVPPMGMFKFNPATQSLSMEAIKVSHDAIKEIGFK